MSRLLANYLEPGKDDAIGAVYVMRHGHTVLDLKKRSDGWLDFPLSDDGRLGIIEPQQRVKTVPFTVIHCSNLRRTHETAHIMSSGIVSSPPVKPDDKGNTWDLGILAGTKKVYGKPRVKALIKNPDSAPLGGESYNEFKRRFLPWFEKIAEAATPEHPVLYVGSGSNLRCIGQEMLGDGDLLDLDEGGLAVLHREGGQWHAEILLGADDNRTEVS